MRIVFMGTPGFAVKSLEACLELGEVVAVVTQPDKPRGRGQEVTFSPVKELAVSRNGRDLDAVLEIGTGCGYQTAELAHVARHVYSVERIGALVAKARRHLRSLKLGNVALKHGDGSADLGEDLAVDAIVVTAGATHLPTALLRYLKPGGRMVIPLSQPEEGERGTQYLTVIESSAGSFREQRFDAVRFVPLLPGLA